MTIFITIVTLAIVGWLIVTTYLNYRKATGTTWQRLLSAADDSATLLWSKFMLLVSALTGVLTNAADYFGDPSLSSAIKEVLQPQYVAYFAIAVTFITIWARHRDVK
jgi:hypothetical protein